jgi:hypothetical protein
MASWSSWAIVGASNTSPANKEYFDALNKSETIGSFLTSASHGCDARAKLTLGCCRLTNEVVQPQVGETKVRVRRNGSCNSIERTIHASQTKVYGNHTSDGGPAGTRSAHYPH